MELVEVAGAAGLATELAEAVGPAESVGFAAELAGCDAGLAEAATRLAVRADGAAVLL
jgi:hypothetical protein